MKWAGALVIPEQPTPRRRPKGDAKPPTATAGKARARLPGPLSAYFDPMPIRKREVEKVEVYPLGDRPVTTWASTNPPVTTSANIEPAAQVYPPPEPVHVEEPPKPELTKDALEAAIREGRTLHQLTAMFGVGLKVIKNRKREWGLLGLSPHGPRSKARRAAKSPIRTPAEMEFVEAVPLPEPEVREPFVELEVKPISLEAIEKRYYQPEPTNRLTVRLERKQATPEQASNLLEGLADYVAGLPGNVRLRVEVEEVV